MYRWVVLDPYAYVCTVFICIDTGVWHSVRTILVTGYVICLGTWTVRLSKAGKGGGGEKCERASE